MFPTVLRPEDKADVQNALVEQFEVKIRDKAFPCVGAKSALATRQMQFLVVGDIRYPRDDIAIYDTVRDFAGAFHCAPQPFQSLVVLFQTDDQLTEEDFEKAMWRRIEALETLDAKRGYSYDPRVSADVDDPNFSLSFAGEAFFVVGLHPNASRPARKFDRPALIFNAHDQFETLRIQGRYETMRETIINRDIAFAGTANPMLGRHGETSEASQYSGRQVDQAWKCPMHRIHP